MKLRIAKKICAAMCEDSQSTLQHSAQQQQAAVNRIFHTKSSKQADAFWDDLMHAIGVKGRAEVLAGFGRAGHGVQVANGRGVVE